MQTNKCFSVILANRLNCFNSGDAECYLTTSCLATEPQNDINTWLKSKSLRRRVLVFCVTDAPNDDHDVTLLRGLGTQGSGREASAVNQISPLKTLSKH